MTDEELAAHLAEEAGRLLLEQRNGTAASKARRSAGPPTGSPMPSS